MGEKYMIDTEKTSVEVEKDGVLYIEETVYRVFNDGTKEVACTASYPKPSDEPVEPEFTQLDRMEEKIDTLVSGTTVENTEALNALFGV